MKLSLLLLLLVAAVPAALHAEPRKLQTPPMAKKIPVVTEKHGIKLTDNYAWLRDQNDVKSREVMDYLKAENAYTRHAMKDTELLQQQLYEEMKGRIKEDDLSVPVKNGKYIYYSKMAKGKEYPIHYRRLADESKPEELILDENVLAAGKEFFECGSMEISPNDNILAYTVDTDGDEKYDCFFYDLKNKKLLKDCILDIPTNIEWAADNKTLFYAVMDETTRPYQIKRHTLGTDSRDDVLVYEEKDPLFCASICKSRDDRFMVISTGSTQSTEEYILDAKNPTGEFKCFCPRKKDVEYYLTFQNPYIYVTTNENALNFKVMRATEKNWNKADWEEFIPHNENVYIDGLSAFENYLVICERVNGLQKIRYIDIRRNKNIELPFPEAVYSVTIGNNPEYKTTKLRYIYDSLTTPESVIDYDFETGLSECKKRREVVGDFKPSNYVSERIFATAKDGTQIPISLVYRKDQWGYGPSSLYLTAYGAYGISTDPCFSSVYLSLLDRGYVYAIAHIRGGQEMGRKWYEDGKYLNKKNSFTDFIACAEHLIEQGYTRPEYLAIEGGSAGGLLMGAVTNMRPDLFKVVIADVPFVDMLNTMLDPTLPLTIGEYEEWGCPEDKKYFEYMHTYSPYDNIEAKDYPNMLVTAGLNDPRVSYWEPAKYVAKLRAMKTDNNLLCLKTNMSAGHMGASGRYEYLKEIALTYAFIFKHLNTHY